MPSPYGTFDQGGNVWEWNEAITIDGSNIFRGMRGGFFNGDAGQLAASYRTNEFHTFEINVTGFRVAMIPEPGTGLLMIAGLLGLAGGRRTRA